MRRPMFSIVVPTYNRRDVLLGTVAALSRAEQPWPVELIVVVDGSEDGSAEAIEALELPMSVRVIRQQNAGAAAARNRGAAEATGQFVLFLDDDMTVDPRILLEHEILYAAGADAVIGDIPLHPDSPHNLLTVGVQAWTRLRCERLAGANGKLTIDDLLTGQLSVRAEVFRQVGGFDSSFTSDGQFGGEDTDFGYRLLAHGADVRYTPKAISYQRYVVTPQQHMRQWREAGRADAMLTLKHPAMAAELADRCGGPLRASMVSTARSWLPTAVQRGIVRLVVGRAARGRTGPLTRYVYGRVREAHYWAGRLTAGGHPRAGMPLQVLAYHAVDDDAAGPSNPYAVTAGQLEEHLQGLLRQGFTFVDLDTYLGHLRGKPVLRPSLLLTFDDGYAGLLRHAAPTVARLGVPAVVFVVTGQLAGWNRWDCPDPAHGVPLLDAEGLRTLARQGWRIESHTADHEHLTQLPVAELRAQLEQARKDLLEAGFRVPRVIAYPYGEHSRRVRREALRAGYRAAFALRTRSGRSSGAARYALARVEVRHDTTFSDLLAAVLAPARTTRREWWRRELRSALRSSLGPLRSSLGPLRSSLRRSPATGRTRPTTPAQPEVPGGTLTDQPVSTGMPVRQRKHESLTRAG